jgi:precorrin-2 dehydrogenase/sirohydrochlorin ferrochelatase
VIAATDSTAVNLQVYESIQPRQWINIVDHPELCTFYVPAVTERGSLQIATFTGGKYPGLTKKLNQKIAAVIGPEYEQFVDFLGDVRARVMRLNLDDNTKKQTLGRLLDEEFLLLTKDGRNAERDQKVNQMLAPYERGAD